MIILPLTEIERSCSFIGNDKIVKGNTGMFISQYAISIALPISYKKFYKITVYGSSAGTNCCFRIE